MNVKESEFCVVWTGIFTLGVCADALSAKLAWENIYWPFTVLFHGWGLIIQRLLKFEDLVVHQPARLIVANACIDLAHDERILPGL